MLPLKNKCNSFHWMKWRSSPQTLNICSENHSKRNICLWKINEKTLRYFIQLLYGFLLEKHPVIKYVFSVLEELRDSIQSFISIKESARQNFPFFRNRRESAPNFFLLFLYEYLYRILSLVNFAFETGFGRDGRWTMAVVALTIATIERSILSYKYNYKIDLPSFHAFTMIPFLFRCGL